MALLLSRYLLPLLLLTALLLPAQAAQSAQLVDMSKRDDLAGTRVRFQFSELPAFRIAGSGQRVDLFFSDVTVKPNLRLLREDGRIVKVLLAQSREELMVSLLLRQVPARTATSTDKKSASVQLEIFWEEGNQTKPAVAFRISGLPHRQERSAVSRPEQVSEFTGQWLKFFETYQSPFSIGVPLAYSLPELPLPPRNLFPPGHDALHAKVARGNWPGVLLELMALAPSGQPLPASLQLLKAEALIRTTRPRPALNILDGFPPSALPPDLEARAGYLNGLAMALCNDPYGGNIRLTETANLPSANSYRPFLLLLQSELALVRGDYRQALEALDSSHTAWPDSLRPLCDLRKADALSEIEEPHAALDIYQALLQGKNWPENSPYSLRQAAKAFSRAGNWKDAGWAYRQLAEKLPPGPAGSQASFAAALAAYRSGEVEEAVKSLWHIRENFPRTEGAIRADLKLLDHGVTSGKQGRLLQAIQGYEAIAAQAGSRQLREEAAFKYCLALFLNGEQIRTIETLEKFRRDFSGGPLRREADALLSEIVPPLIEKLIGEGQDLQAVILVEKYRDLLLSGNGNWPFLPSLAHAFTRLGLFERGCKVYLYLLEKMKNRPEAGRFYLPLAGLYFDLDEHEMVEQYTRSYLVKFPEGEDRKAIFLLRLQALRKLNRFERAAELLKERNRPSDNRIELAAAQIFWHLGDYDQVISSANHLGNNGKAVPPEGLLLQAEALRRLGRARKALPLYQVLVADGTFGDQATFRCGEILLADGQRDEALKLFAKLAEKGEDLHWRKLAEDALEAARF